MKDPGGLADLGAAGRAAWDDAVRVCYESALEAVGDRPSLLPAPDERTRELTSPTWTGLPLRVVSCLGRRRALAALDDQRRLQEEYLEWRVVRGADGRIRRVELTTELRDYWTVLAACEPERALDLAGELVGRPVRSEELYGGPVPDAPDAREAAFTASTVERSNPLNDGREGILFMQAPENDLRALVNLAAAAAAPCVVSNAATGVRRCARANEAIPLLAGAARAGRASDPVVVERVGRLAFERRLIALDDPVGVYIRGVEHTRLRTPGGEEVPPEWFVASRGRRLVLEVPEDDLVVGDLVDAATEQRIDHGGQVAELTELGVLLRTSAPSVVASDAAVEFDPARAPADPCADILEAP